MISLFIEPRALEAPCGAAASCAVQVCHAIFASPIQAGNHETRRERAFAAHPCTLLKRIPKIARWRSQALLSLGNKREAIWDMLLVAARWPALIPKRFILGQAFGAHPQLAWRLGKAAWSVCGFSCAFADMRLGGAL
jgi:hypothetical protein